MTKFKVGEAPRTSLSLLVSYNVILWLMVSLVFGIKMGLSLALSSMPAMSWLNNFYPDGQKVTFQLLSKSTQLLSFISALGLIFIIVLFIGTTCYIAYLRTFKAHVIQGLKQQFADGTTTNVLGLQPNATVPTPRVAEVEKLGNLIVSAKIEVPIKGRFNADKVSILPLSSAVLKNFIVESLAVSDDQNNMYLKLRNMRYSRQIIAENAYDLAPKNNHTFSLMKGVNWDVLKAPHAVISGVTGSGKSYFVYSLVYQALKMNAEVIVIDPKSDDLSTLEGAVSAVAISPEEALTTLDKVVRRLHQRQEKIRLKKLVAKNPQDVSALSTGERPIIVFIDELAALQAAVSNDRQKSQQLEASLKTITLLGRSSMINIVFILQQANAKNIPTEAREQAGLKVLLGNSTTETRRFLLPGQDLATTDFPRNSGKGYYTLDGVTKGAAELIETPTIKFNIFHEISRLRE